MAVPDHPKIYHIVHVDRLSSILADGCLWCDAEVVRNAPTGTTIGMSKIKQRRLKDLTLTSHPGLHVGDCVPFYFCPRSIMLYLIAQGNHPELEYRGGQDPIIHLEADLHEAVAWAGKNQKRWAFTTSNAGSTYFEDFSKLTQLGKINWDAVQARQWGGPGISPSIKEGKQAEFLIEHQFPWRLVERIGIRSKATYQRVLEALSATSHRPQVVVDPDWYY